MGKIRIQYIKSGIGCKETHRRIIKALGLKKLNQFVLLDLERDIRTTALAEGQDDVKTLMELVELSKRRKQFNP